MEVAQQKTVAVRRSGEKKRPEFADLVRALGCEAHRLTRPVQLLGAVFLFVALLLWLLVFYSYSFDTFKSLAVCLVFLAFALTPGLVFLGLTSSLRQLALLPSRLPAVKAAQPARDEPQQAGETTESAPGATGWFQRLKAGVDNVLVLWEHLSFSQKELEQLSGPSRSLTFMAHPASVFLVAAALVIGIFVALGTVVALFGKLVSWIF